MNSLEFPWATPPYQHQRDIFARSWHLPGFLINAEQGTGKAKIGADTAAALALDGKIDRMLVVAPNEVHANWIEKELPQHMSRAVPWCGFAFNSRDFATKRVQKELEAFRHDQRFHVLAITYDGVKTDAGFALCERFLKAGRGLMILDESQRIKNVKAGQSKACRKLGRLAPYRRTMSGTPQPKDPSDHFNPVDFACPDFWPRHGIKNMTAFKSAFALYEPRPWAPRGHIVGWRQLDQLRDMLKEVSVRVLKADVLDLPPKVYKTINFNMSPAQQRAYDTLRKEYVVELESGLTVTAAMAAVRVTRLQQIACNYLPTGEDDTYEQITDDNPRIKLLVDQMEDVPNQAIIWYCFREDGRLIEQALKNAGMTCGRVDGTVKHDDRVLARKRFADGDAQFLLANPATLSTGVTLNEAKSVVYYSQRYNYELRAQSEDRCHRIGQTVSVDYTDYVARATVDEMVRKNLVGKHELAQVVNGDTWSAWIGA